MKLFSPCLLLLAPLLALAPQLTLAQQALIPAQSGISFVFKQMGVPVEGHFKTFKGQVNFDVNKLAASKVALTVEIGSATLGSPETDAELPKSEWFNTARFPQATFVSSAFKGLGSGKYEVAGKLSIKGLTRDVVVPVTLSQSGAVTLVVGRLPIKRLGFKIGENEWADTALVADDVQVKFRLALNGVGKL